GTLTSAHTIQWSNIPLDPPGDSQVRYLNISNVRIDAAQIGYTPPQNPNQILNRVRMTVQITGASSIPVDPGDVEVGQTGQGLNATGDSGFPAVPGATVEACANHNGMLLGGVGVPAFDFNIRAKEGISSYLRPRNVAVSADGNSAPPLAAQNVPGYYYYTESAFYFPGLFSDTPAVGLADFGSRIQVFINDSAAGSGVHFFVPVTVNYPFATVQPPPAVAPGLPLPTLRLVRTDEFGMSGPGFTPIAATANVAGVPVAEMTYSSGF